MSKAGTMFKTFIAPVAALACGYFIASYVFGWAAGWIAGIDIQPGTTTHDLADAFGAEKNGVLIVLGLVLAGLGFWLFSTGGYVRIAGLFIVGAAIKALQDGFKNVSWAVA